MTSRSRTAQRRPIRVLDSPSAARDWCADARAFELPIGFVPTMGALHEGHLELVRRAVEENERACVSVFVNPLQFDEQADLDAYPRNLERDAKLLESVGCQMVFTGTLAEFFPEYTDAASIPSEDPGAAAAGLEGEFRKGHFEGVATICRRLFEVVRPRRAYFGQKDYQQTLVVRQLAQRLGFPEIVVCPTSRDADGLARSSRNARLTSPDRTRALSLSRALFKARAAWGAGERTTAKLERVLDSELGDVDVEYAVVRDAESLGPLNPNSKAAQALVAARVGDVRLIDNLALDSPEFADDALPKRDR